MFYNSNSAPYYIQIAHDLRNQILNNEYQLDEQIPTEGEIANHYNVSRMTARNAVTILVDEGLVYRVHGLGVYVLSNKIRRNLNKLTGFYEDMNNLNFDLKTRVLMKEIREPNKDERRHLQIIKNEKVLYVERLRYVDESPVGLQKLTIPIQRVEGIEKLDFEKESFYLYLEKIGKPLKNAQQKMEALISNDVSKLMEIDNNMPYFYFERISYGESSEPIEFLESYFRGDFYSYNINLSR